MQFSPSRGTSTRWPWCWPTSGGRTPSVPEGSGGSRTGLDVCCTGSWPTRLDHWVRCEQRKGPRPGSNAGACWSSRWTAIPLDVQALGLIAVAIAVTCRILRILATSWGPTMQARRDLSQQGRCGYDEEQLGWKVMGLNLCADKSFPSCQISVKYVYFRRFKYNMKLIHVRDVAIDCFPHACEKWILSLVNKSSAKS